MASNDSKSIEEQKQDYEKLAQEKFNKILAAYRQVIDGISPNHFKLVDKIVGKETKKAFDVKKAGDIFKEHLFELIKKKFTKTWSDLEMNEKLIILEFGKKNLVTDAQDAWRPTNKTVEEQCNPHIINALSKQRALFQRQIEFQNQQIAMIIPQIEEARKLLKSRVEKRNQIMVKMKQDLEKVKEAEGELAVEVKKMYKIDS